MNDYSVMVLDIGTKGGFLDFDYTKYTLSVLNLKIAFVFLYCKHLKMYNY